MAFMQNPAERPSVAAQSMGTAPQAAPQAPMPSAPSRQTKYNAFDAAIPGQSLTETPGNAKYEHPPQFADPEKAMNFVYKQLMRPNQLKQTIALLKQGVPVEGVARTILFTGFATGKWTPDVAMLMAKPLVATLVAIAKQADVKKLKVMLNPDEGKEPLQKLASIEAGRAVDLNKMVIGPSRDGLIRKR